MTKEALTPYISRPLLLFFKYIVVPAIFIISGLINISINDLGVYVIAIFISIYYFLVYFIPGVLAFVDLITKDYIIVKMSYIYSIVQDEQFFLRLCGKNTHQAFCGEVISETCYLRIVLAGNKGRATFSSTFFHSMETGKSYTITYGKHSKVILSIRSKTGDELLQFDTSATS